MYVLEESQGEQAAVKEQVQMSLFTTELSQGRKEIKSPSLGLCLLTWLGAGWFQVAELVHSGHHVHRLTPACPFPSYTVIKPLCSTSLWEMPECFCRTL